MPKRGTRKLICVWRGPHKVTDVLQDGRLDVLDTGQMVHFERLKKHVPAPWNWTTHKPFGLDQNVAIIADPYIEESHEEITSDISRDSFLPEQLPKASFELKPTRPILHGQLRLGRKQLLSKEYLEGGSVTLVTSPTQSQNGK